MRGTSAQLRGTSAQWRGTSAQWRGPIHSFIPILQTLEKICNKCGRSLPLSEFSSNISNPDGLDYTCRRCRRRLDFARRGGRRKDPLRYVTDSELLAEAARRGLIPTTPPTTTNP